MGIRADIEDLELSKWPCGELRWIWGVHDELDEALHYAECDTCWEENLWTRTSVNWMYAPVWTGL